MFEKEAEEYAKVKEIERNNLECIIVVNHEVSRAFKDGAEFGYNKAIVEIKDAYEGNGNFLAWFENYLEGKNV